MKESKYICPICQGNDLELKHEASYVYSYLLDSDAPGSKNSDVFLSYLYDRRERTKSKEYIQCNQCGTRFSPTFLNGVLEKANEAKSKE